MGLAEAVIDYEAEKLTAFEWRYLIGMMARKKEPVQMSIGDKHYELVVKEIEAK